MTVRLANDRIVLEDSCGIDEAEPLLRLLQERPDAVIDWSECRAAHTAIIQLLLAAERRVEGQPRSPMLRWVRPLLVADRD